MTQTIIDLTDDEKLKLEFAKRRRAHASKDLADDTKYAVVILSLHPTVVPGDYPTLKAAIIAVTGVTDVDLLIDHQTRAVVPADHTQVLGIRADVTLRDDTPPE